MAASVASASNLARITDDTPAHEQSHAATADRCGTSVRRRDGCRSRRIRPVRGRSRCSAMSTPPANIVGGNSVPLGRPVVPEVYSRFGRGTIESGGSSVATAGQPLVPVGHTLDAVAVPADDGVDAGLCALRATPRSTVSGPTNTISSSLNPRGCTRPPSAVRWKLTGTDRRTGQAVRRDGRARSRRRSRRTPRFDAASPRSTGSHRRRAAGWRSG